ncbi:MAG: glyoxylate reductase [Verrucomicrobiales bacterium]|jgi:glyoxylate reductase
MKPKLFIPQPIPQVAVDRLEDMVELTIYPHTDRRMPYEEVLEAVVDQDILYALGEIPYDARTIEAAKNLKLIAAMHGSATFVDMDAATKRGIPLSLIPKRMSKTTAEFTFALMVATAWRIPEADQFMRAGKWKQNQSMAFLGSRLFDKTLGVVGMGSIGTDLAIKSRALGMDIIYNKRSQMSRAEEASIGAEYRSLEALFAEADIICVCPALTNETKGMITRELIDSMKPSAIFINTSRGLVIDEDALEDALVEGRIRGAGLDVYHREIPEVDDPGPSERFKSLPNVVLTPHIGTAALETREEMAMRNVDNIERFLNGVRPHNVKNPEVYGEEPIESDVIG